jgi:hypothetical protein
MVPVSGLQRITGTVSDLKCARDVASFVFSQSEQTAMGVVAIAASLAGASAQAASTASSDMMEEADYVEFTLDGQPVKGWLWRSPFDNGDAVEVVAEWQHDHFEAYAVARPADRMIALYPHCSRGRTSHWLNAGKWWAILSTITLTGTFLMFLLVSLFDSSSWEETIEIAADLVPIPSIMLALLALIFTVLLAKRWMSFVGLAELVFRKLDLSGPGTIDLKKSSTRQRTSADGAEYGVFYFRY